MASKRPTGLPSTNWAFPTAQTDEAAARRKAEWQANQDRLRALHSGEASAPYSNRDRLKALAGENLLEQIDRREREARSSEEVARLQRAADADVEWDRTMAANAEATVIAAANLAASIERAKGPSAQLVCPHCQTKGFVRTSAVKRKKGISGGKAVGAVLTAGLSMLVTGLARKESETEAHCSNCSSTWHF